MLGKGRRFGQEEEEVKPDLSPMIDCIFILLIFFIVTTVFVEEKGLKVNRPEDTSSVSTANDNNSVLLNISAENKITFENKEYKFGNIQSLVREKLAEDDQLPVIIQGDIKAKHGIVTQIYNECQAAGAEKITVTTR